MRTIARISFTTVKTEGAILPADLLQRIADGRDMEGLQPEDYHLLPGERLNEAVNRAWNRCVGAWAAFQDGCARLPTSDAGTTLTRERWLLILFQELGYGRLPYQGSLSAGSDSDALPVPGPHGTGRYPISHAWGHAPLHLVTFRQDLDKRDPASRRSPHSLVQEYLNRAEGSLWGMVGNGLRLRVLRDNASLTRAAYVEFDLEAMFDGELYADFALLWLVCHESRVEAMPASNCWLEKWFQASAAQGVRALETLRDGVQQSISALGRGFLAHPANHALRDALQHGTLAGQDYYRQLLRLVYRLIFLLVAEERDLLLLPDTPDETRRRYDEFYCVRRLRDLAETLRGGPHADLYRGLRLVLEKLREGCPPLGLPALGSYLFSDHSTPDLDGADLSNATLLEAVRALCFTVEGRVRRTVDFRNLDAEELGSVYESLLELHPHLHTEAGTFDLEVAAGSERKTTGSYYTPTSLINSLLDTALEPVVADRLAQAGRDPAAQEKALLAVKVVDPACGSGHFLIAAARRLARHLARARTGDEEPAPAELRAAMRDVVRHCIHGVDLNPMAVELCKVALWMETLDPGKPLGFLDRNIQCGNSLIGATPALLDSGIPDEAFTPIEGDDRAYCSEWRKRNKQQRESGQMSLFTHDLQPWDRLGDLAAGMMQLEGMADDTLDGVRRQQDLYESLVRSSGYRYGQLLADAWCAAFVWKKTDEFAYPITEDVYRAIQRNPFNLVKWMEEEIARLRGQYQFFHWHLAFPSVFRPPARGEAPQNEQMGWSGGFDVVLGNPPWEKIQVEEQAFFASVSPEISAAAGSRRKTMISALKAQDPQLHRRWLDHKRSIAIVDQFIKASSRYPLTGQGKLNTYAVFCELSTTVISQAGAAGIIVPLGIVTDYYTSDMFWALMQKKQLKSLFGFENEALVFPEVHHSFKFALLSLLGRARPVQSVDLIFYCRAASDIHDPSRHFTLTSSDIVLLNPNTRNCPILRFGRDFQIVRGIYSKYPIIAADDRQGPWNVEIHRIVNPTDDSALMLELSADPACQHSRSVAGRLYVPVYEAKMIHQYDHRFGSYVGQTAAQAEQGKLPEFTEREHQDPTLYSQPRYWVEHAVIEPWLSRHTNRRWLLAYRDITSPVVVRTTVSAVIPRIAPVDPCRCIFFDSSTSGGLICCFVAALNSYVFDYVCRQKFSGTHLAIFVLKQLVVPPPSVFGTRLVSKQSAHEWILPRVLELTYTAWDLKPFALDCGYDGPPFHWDQSRRFLLRCELDAAYFHLYRITRDDALYIMDTFTIVRQRDEAVHGEYRTKRVILEMYDAMQRAMDIGEPYQTRLDPPPADPRVAHSAKEARR